MKDNALSKYHIEKDINMSDSKIKVSELYIIGGIAASDQFYVVVSADNTDSKRCTFGTLTQQISNDIGM